MQISALDLETYPITPGCILPKPISWSVCDAEGTRLGLVDERFTLPEGLIVCANTAFDLGVMFQHLGADAFTLLEARRFTDIIVRQQLLDIADGLGTDRSYKLEALAKRLLGVELGKNQELATSFHKVANVQPQDWPAELRRYASLDVEATLAIYHLQEKHRSAEHMHRWEHFETTADFCLSLMEAWGVRADPVWWAKLKADVDVKYQVLLQWFRELGVLRADKKGKETKNKKRLQELVTEAYHGNPPLTKTGQVSTDRLTLEESGDPTLEKLTGDGPIEKIVTTYGKVVEDAAKRVYNPRYKVLVSSGRTSGNFQQWPRGGPNAPEEVNRLRACFVPRQSYLFCSVDFTGAELVSLAQVCFKMLGYSRIRDALNKGENLHTKLAARFVGCSYEDASRRLKTKDPALVSARQGAKPVNFGLPGLMGAERLVGAAHKDFVFFCELSKVRKECAGSKCRDCLEIAKEYIKAYRAEYPEVKEYHQRVLNSITDPWETPLTGFLRGGLAGSEACNHPFQHLTSRMAKSAMMALAKECYTNRDSPLWGTRPWLFAHDEIIAEVPVDKASEAGDEMCRVMLEAAKIWTPDVALTGEPALMDRWYKSAECVRRDGKLVLWQPAHHSSPSEQAQRSA